MKTTRIFTIFCLLIYGLVLQATTYEYNGFSFELDVSAQTATLIKKTSGNYSGNIIIPESFEGPKNIEYKVTAIGDNAFYGCSGVESISIPNTVLSIGAFAFESCNKLTSISLPTLIGTIGESAFKNCSALTSITLPTNITIVSKSLFNGCSKLSSVTFGQYISAIEDDAFSGCSKLVTLSFPSHLQTIGNSAFAGCSALKSLTLPENVTSVGDNSFQNCSAMRVLRLSKKLQTIGNSAFSNTASLSTLTIPASVKTIGKDAFSSSGILSLTYAEGCEIALRTYATNMNSVSLPSTINAIDNNAFNGCRYLANITLSDAISTIGESAFFGCTSLAAIIIPKSVKSIGINAFGNSGISYLEYADGCTVALRTYASNVTSLFIPATVEEFADNAFSDFNILENVFIYDLEMWNYIFSRKIANPIPVAHKIYLRGNLLTALNADFGCDISNYAFYGCKELRQVNITGSITGIQDYAFTQCPDLEAVVISNNVSFIGKDAFQGCSKLSSIRIGSGIKTIGKNAFYGCTKLNSVLMGSSVTTIDDAAFKGCNSLPGLELPNTLISIGCEAFSGCSSLQTVSIPSGVSQIAESTFYECNNLQEVILPEAITAIGSYSFYGCKRLRSLHMPDDITFYGTRCFSDCDSLRYVFLGTKVSNIESYAFAANKSLTGFYIETITPPACNTNAFDDSDPQYGSLYVPDESVTSYLGKTPWNKYGTITGISSAPTYVTTITLSAPVIIVGEGEPFNLTATINPSNATNKKVNWTSNNTSVAYINSNGVGLANTEGVTTITATAADNNGAIAKCLVIVSNSFKPVQSISLSEDSVTLAEGKEYLLSAEFLPQEATYNEIIWSSSNPQIAQVNSIGLVKALKVGTATISCTARDGKGANDICKLTVTEAVDPTIGDANEDGSVSVSDLAYAVHIIMEELAKGTDISLYDINGDGEITSEDVLAIADLILGRNSASVVRLLKLSKNSITLGVSESLRLNYTTIPYKYAQKVEWTSNDSEVASVDADGNVTALTVGKTIITVTATDGSGLYDECIVVVDGSFGHTEGHAWVDLGLPSGTHWATQNLGALSAAEYGDYYAWGETTVKDVYDWANYKYCNGSATTLTKYCNAASKGFRDDIRVLQPADDAVTATWGDNWCMPTKEQFDELFNSEYTNTTWTQQNGLYGRLITSKLNGNSIFLPAAGYMKANVLTSYGSGGYYATRNLYEEDADYNTSVNFGSSDTNESNHTFRCYGQSIRPVYSSYILISPKSIRLEVDSTTTLSATVINPNGAFSKIIWTSSNESVAIVSSDGVVKGISKGEAILYAMADNGVTGFCKVIVGDLGFTQLSYISFEGGNFNTGLHSKSTIYYQMKMRPTRGGGGAFLGTGSPDDNHDYRFFMLYTTTYIDVNTSRRSGSVLSLNTDYELEFGNNYLKNLATNKTLLSGISQTFEYPSATIYVCGSHDYAYFYYLKAYDNGILVRDYVPCKRNEDGAIGFYDKLSNNFTPVNGKVTAGPEM